jgi:hypothetical protein
MLGEHFGALVRGEEPPVFVSDEDTPDGRKEGKAIGKEGSPAAGNIPGEGAEAPAVDKGTLEVSKECELDDGGETTKPSVTSQPEM